MKNIYSIRDNKMRSFGSITLMENDEVATRSFADLVNDNQRTIISMHPADFTLCRVGSFDEMTGVISPVDGGYQPVYHGVDVKIVKE